MLRVQKMALKYHYLVNLAKNQSLKVQNQRVRKTELLWSNCPFERRNNNPIHLIQIMNLLYTMSSKVNQNLQQKKNAPKTSLTAQLKHQQYTLRKLVKFKKREKQHGSLIYQTSGTPKQLIIKAKLPTKKTIWRRFKVGYIRTWQMKRKWIRRTKTSVRTTRHEPSQKCKSHFKYIFNQLQIKT